MTVWFLVDTIRRRILLVTIMTPITEDHVSYLACLSLTLYTFHLYFGVMKPLNRETCSTNTDWCHFHMGLEQLQIILWIGKACFGVQVIPRYLKDLTASNVTQVRQTSRVTWPNHASTQRFHTSVHELPCMCRSLGVRGASRPAANANWSTVTPP